MGQSSEYKSIKALSQSSLKQLEYDPKSFYTFEERWLTGELQNKPEFKPTESMKLGEVVDCLLLTPELFESNFLVNNSIPPTGQMLEFVDQYTFLEKEASSNYTIELSKESIQQLAQTAYEYVGFKRDSLSKVLDRFKDEALEYYNMSRILDKTVVNSKMYKLALDLVSLIKEHEYAKKIINLPSDCEGHNQLIVRGQWHSGDGVIVHLKGLLDRVIIDHTAKEIVPIDLKTTSEDYFPNSIISYRYDLQAAFYSHLLAQWMIGKPWSTYRLMPFVFLTVNTVNPKVAMWQLSARDLSTGKFGGETHYGREVKGFSNLLHDYAWHKSNNKWDYPRDIYQGNGLRETNCFRNV